MKKFSHEEDQKIIEYVKLFGLYNWNKISLFFKNRTSKSLKERYYNFINPKINNFAWTLEEDQLLIKKSIEFGKKWKLLSSFFNNRTEKQIKNRFQYLMTHY